MSNDHIALPDFLRPMVKGFFDPYPLYGEGPIEPPAGANIIVNPGFSKKEKAWENAKRWASKGHYVVCYLPVESSTKFGFDVAKTVPSSHRMTFLGRPYEACRGIEWIILEPEVTASDSAAETKT